MNVRLILGSLLLLCAAAPAQEPPVKPAAPTTPATVPPAAGQDPVKPAAAPATPPPAAQSPADVLGQLQRDKERLQSEIEYVRNRAKNANAELASKLGKRGQSFASIDAGTSASAPTPVAQPRSARLMTPAELEGQPKDVMLLLNGFAIRQGHYDELLQYLNTSPVAGTPENRSQRILFDLIRTFSVAAAFPENSAEAQMADAYAQLESGKTVSELVKTYGVMQGAKEDGSIEITRNTFLGTKVEQVAFTLQPGQRSRPFHVPQGMLVLEVVAMEKGATPELDKVKAKALQIGYQADPAMLQKAQAAAVSGQIDIAARDQQVLDMLPAMFKPGAGIAAESVTSQTDNERAMLLDTLKQIDEALAKLQKADTPEAKTQIEALTKQRAQVQAALEDHSKKDGDDAGVVEVPVAPKKPDAPKKEDAPKKQD